MSKSKKTAKTPKTAKPKAKGTKAKADAIASLAGPTQEQAQAAAEAIGQAPENAPAETPTTTAPAAKTPKAPKAEKPRKVSGLDLVAQVLKDKGEPMGAKDIADAVIAAGWQTKGKTPAATLYSAMLREIDGKPSDSRFVKTGRGLFGLANA